MERARSERRRKGRRREREKGEWKWVGEFASFALRRWTPLEAARGVVQTLGVITPRVVNIAILKVLQYYWQYILGYCLHIANTF